MAPDTETIQAPYLSRQFWDRKHDKACQKWLTGSRLSSYLSFFGPQADPGNKNVLEVGCGLAVATKAMATRAKDLWVVDVSTPAIERARGAGAIPVHVNDAHSELPHDYFDLAISYLVIQHIHDWQARDQIRYVLKALSRGGIFCIQYLTRTDVEGDSVPMYGSGTISRSPSFMRALIEEAGGIIVDVMATKDFQNETTEYIPVQWNGYIVGRRTEL
jgi:SAM-dependent methyltransferase